MSILKNILIGVGVLFVLILLIGIFVPSKKTEEINHKPSGKVVKITPTTRKTTTTINKEQIELKKDQEIKSKIYNIPSSGRPKSIDYVTVNRSEYNSNLRDIGLVFTIEPGFMGDDYLEMLHCLKKIYKKIFEIDSSINMVVTVALKNEKDVYGNPIQKQIGRSGMVRKTYQKINWEGFEVTNFPQITFVQFTGESTYKDLEDLQKSFESLPSDIYVEGDFPSGFDPCELAREQCLQDNYGCDIYEMMKSQGIC